MFLGRWTDSKKEVLEVESVKGGAKFAKFANLPKPIEAFDRQLREGAVFARLLSMYYNWTHAQHF